MTWRWWWRCCSWFLLAGDCSVRILAGKDGHVKLPDEILVYFQKQGARGGKVGGVARSKAKIAAARANGKKGGRPRKQPAS
jgi:hypothetical protein